MDKKKLLYGFLLIVAAVVWGFAFVAQRVGMDYMRPFTFSFARFFLGSIVLIPVCIVLVRKSRKNRLENTEKIPTNEAYVVKHTIVGGIICGAVLCLATALQQYAIQYTSVGKAGFITALYIIFVPLLGLFFHKKATKLVTVSVMLAMVGLYFLCIPSGQWVGFTGADQLLLISALCYAIHILVISYFSPKGFPVVISAIQFFVAGLLSFVFAIIFEHPTFTDIYAGRIAVLYAGIMACGVAYTLQIIAQKHVEPTTTSLILSMESVTSALAGWIILNQSMNGREISGATLMFLAMILAQIPATIFIQKKFKIKKIAYDSNS